MAHSLALASDAQPACTVLCVDDEPHILSALRRLLRGRFRMLDAGSGPAALALLETEEVDLIVSDMRMPGMDGATLLEQVRARWPAVERLLLTGQSDLSSTLAAINRGEVYRYITKPWDDGDLLLTLSQAAERAQLRRDRERLEALTQQQNRELHSLNTELEAKVRQRTAELSEAHEKLKRSYLHAIKAFSNLLELRGGKLLGHARHVADGARRTAKALGMNEVQQQDIFIAGLLHDIGQIGLPDRVLAESVARLGPAELNQYRRHPVLGEQALLALDDMQAVAPLIRWHHERHDGNGYPDGLSGAAIPLGAAILAVVESYEDWLSGHLGRQALSQADAQEQLKRGRGSLFRPEVVDAFLSLDSRPRPATRTRSLRSAELQPGMVLAEGLHSREGVMLLAPDYPLSAELIQRIRAYEARDGLSLMHKVKVEG